MGLFRHGKVSVVIPALNEGKTIGAVVRLAKMSPNVDEVIVIDDNSEDNTVEEAQKNGAKVLQSAIRGKGISMKEGMDAAKNEVLVYIDGDIDNYETDVIKKLSDPILYNTCDFVKATFSRDTGRVTELVAKPLLSILFPELTIFSQPLSGMIAAKKQFLRKVTFENDYGVDIGILIDMYSQGARIQEVNIGKIENKSKPWQALGAMSREVSRAILKRAAFGKLIDANDVEMINVVEDAMENSINESLHKSKLVLLDIDGVVFTDSFLVKVGEKCKLQSAIRDIVLRDDEPYIKTKLLAGLFKGIKAKALYDVLETMKFVPDITAVVKTLHDRGYLVGIIGDCFDIASLYAKNTIGADFALSNELEIKSGKLTGEVRIPFCFIRNDKSLCSHSVCKSNALRYLAEKYNIKISDMIAVGKLESSVCMLKLAGLGIAYNSDSKLVNNAAAKKVIKSRTLKDILAVIV